MSLNKAMIIGFVGKDPEIRYIDGQPDPTKVAQFTVATSERMKSRTGNPQEVTEWHNIVAWRQLADICEKWVKKGRQVFVEGRLRTRTWQDAQGRNVSRTEIIAERLQLLGTSAKPESDTPSGTPGIGHTAAAPAQPPQQPHQQQLFAKPDYGKEPTDDLPF